jgi:hypothetical protein
MRKKAGILIFLMAVGTIAMKAEEIAKISEQNKLLENELDLARTPASYMVINVQDQTISLKARGMTLKKWEIKSSKFWGRPIPSKTYKLVKKSALSQPKRPNITPGKEDIKDRKKAKDSATDLGVLELKDMPVHYRLSFENRIYISVRPKTKRFWPTILNIGKFISWFTYLPLKTLWLTIIKKDFTEIELVLPSEKEAQEIYWSFPDGHMTIICLLIKS